jgi:hypothetical protein
MDGRKKETNKQRDPAFSLLCRVRVFQSSDWSEQGQTVE